MSDPQHQSDWAEQPDGARIKITNGIRIIDRTMRAEPTVIEHLVTWEDSGRVVVLGLDTACRPVYTTTLFSYL
jgi:hypothetical protein